MKNLFRYKRYFDHWPVHYSGLLMGLSAIFLTGINIAFLYFDGTFFPEVVVLSCVFLTVGIGFWFLHPRDMSIGELNALSKKEQLMLLWFSANWWQKTVWVLLIFGGGIGGAILAYWLEA